MKVVHTLDKVRLRYVTHNGVADLHLTECGLAYISKSQQPDRWSANDSKVTCKKCRKTRFFERVNDGLYVQS